MYKDAGVKYCIAFKPNALWKRINTDAEIAYGMKAAKASGRFTYHF